MIEGLLRRRSEPARPGPGPMPEPLLRRLDLAVAHRVAGLLPGEHRSTQLGRGSELAQIRPYQPGEDDVRHIDWNVTARTGEPHVRVHLAERALVTWLVVDASPSMEFGTATRRKADVAVGAALAIGYVAGRHANRLGAVTFGNGSIRAHPPLQGRRGLLAVLTALEAEDQSRSRDDRQPVGATSLGEALRRTGAVARTPGQIVVVSDLRGPRDWRAPLVGLAGRHRVDVVEIRDPREQELPRFGELRLVDPETGRQLRVDTSSERLRARFAHAAAAERGDAAATLASAGAHHVVLSTEGDWLLALVAFLRRRLR